VDYLTELRLKKSKELLRELHFTIYEIAEKVGFSSSQYFSRVFKQVEGMTPTIYRNNVLRGRRENRKLYRFKVQNSTVEKYTNLYKFILYKKEKYQKLKIIINL